MSRHVLKRVTSRDGETWKLEIVKGDQAPRIYQVYADGGYTGCQEVFRFLQYEPAKAFVETLAYASLFNQEKT